MTLRFSDPTELVRLCPASCRVALCRMNLQVQRKQQEEEQAKLEARVKRAKELADAKEKARGPAHAPAG